MVYTLYTGNMQLSITHYTAKMCKAFKDVFLSEILITITKLMWQESLQWLLVVIHHKVQSSVSLMKFLLELKEQDEQIQHKTHLHSRLLGRKPPTCTQD